MDTYIKEVHQGKSAHLRQAWRNEHRKGNEKCEIARNPLLTNFPSSPAAARVAQKCNACLICFVAVEHMHIYINILTHVCTSDCIAFSKCAFRNKPIRSDRKHVCRIFHLRQLPTSLLFFLHSVAKGNAWRCCKSKTSFICEIRLSEIMISLRCTFSYAVPYWRMHVKWVAVSL